MVIALGSVMTTQAVTTLSKFHIDILDLAYEDGGLHVGVHDHTHDVEYEANTVILAVTNRAQTTIPTSPAFGFLGVAGNTTWIIPPVQDPEILFGGIASEEIEPGIFVDNTVRASLVSVSGPGNLAMYSVDGFGVPHAKFNSADGIDSSDYADVPAGGHTDFSWAFSAPGTYHVSFRATGTLDDGTNTFVDSGPVAYTFVVAAPDVTKPVVSIISPLAGSTNNPATTPLIGVVTDAVRVTKVFVSLNNAGYGEVLLASNTTVVNWSTNLTLTPGTNTVAVKAFDKAGNQSLVMNRTFFYPVIETITISTNGFGGVVATASLLGTPTNGASILVGRGYRITAVPPSGQVFTGWTGSVTSSSPALNFLMAPGMVLTANFLPKALNAIHADIGLAYENGAWNLHVHDHTHDFEFTPATATYVVDAPAQTTVTSSSPAFTNILGATGSTVWILPQVQDPELLFLGVAAEEVPEGLFVDDTMRLSLVSVSGPGKFAMYSVDGFGTPTARFNTRDGIDTNDFVTVPAGGHTDYNFAFSAPGFYTVSLRAAATLNGGTNTVVDSGPVAYRFQVIARTTFSKFHIDVLDLAFEDNGLHVGVHDHTHDVEYEANRVILAVTNRAQTTIPTSPAFSFLGTAGSATWIVPQVQDGEILFGGIASEEIAPGIFVDDTVRASLVSVSGPGNLAMYSVDGFGAPHVKFNSADGIDANDYADVPAEGHTDFNWAFSAPGTYYASFRATGTLNDGTNTFVDSGPVAYTFVVAAADITKPTIVITTPLDNSTNNPWATTLSGVAKDNVRVTKVMVSLNNSAFESIGLSSNATLVNWSTILNLEPGTNTVTVKSIDKAGNESLLVKRMFFLQVNELLTITTNGMGSVAGKTNLVLGTPVDGASLLVGRPYQVTAIPGPNQVFSNWTGSVSSSNAMLPFIMQSNMVLTANFIPNPFIPAAGTYNGLFYQTNETIGITHQSAGFFSILLATNFNFSGKVVLNGDTVSLSGKFNLDGTFTKTFSRAIFGKSTLTITLALNFADGADQVTGTIAADDWNAELKANRTTFGPFNNATAYAGTYTMLIPGFTNSVEGPTGYGYGSVTVNTNGLITMVGTAADGQPLNQSIAVSKDGEWPFYQQLYNGKDVVGVKTNVNYKGSMLGWLTFTNLATTNLSPTGPVSWIKTGLSNSLYASGFSNQIDVIGSVYHAPLVGTRALAITNGTSILTNGDLSIALTRNLMWATNNLITVTPTNQLVKLAITLKTGLLTGTFRHPDNTNKVTSIFGAVLQEQNFGGGLFLGTNEGGLFLLQGN
ncbi:MAG: hypothetical protein JWM68_1910 [Verrucomicrobiales bacterium]|nr:hypothetical protein [Verrucomicrobiales bacterium]